MRKPFDTSCAAGDVRQGHCIPSMPIPQCLEFALFLFPVMPRAEIPRQLVQMAAHAGAWPGCPMRH